MLPFMCNSVTKKSYFHHPPPHIHTHKSTRKPTFKHGCIIAFDRVNSAKLRFFLCILQASLYILFLYCFSLLFCLHYWPNTNFPECHENYMSHKLRERKGWKTVYVVYIHVGKCARIMWHALFVRSVIRFLRVEIIDWRVFFVSTKKNIFLILGGR